MRAEKKRKYGFGNRGKVKEEGVEEKVSSGEKEPGIRGGGGVRGETEVNIVSTDLEGKKEETATAMDLRGERGRGNTSFRLRSRNYCRRGREVSVVRLKINDDVVVEYRNDRPGFSLSNNKN